MKERQLRHNFTATGELMDYLKSSGYSELVINHHINYLLEKWEDIVRIYSKIHNNLWEEYLNDLDGRAIFDEIQRFFQEPERSRILSLLEKADNSFLENSVETRACVWGKFNENTHQYTRSREWYYYRVIRCYDNDQWFKFHEDSRPL